MFNSIFNSNIVTPIVTPVNNPQYHFILTPTTPKQVKMVCMGLGLHYNNPFFNHTFNHNTGYQKITGKQYNLQPINLNKSFISNLKKEILYNLKNGKGTPLTRVNINGGYMVFTGGWCVKGKVTKFKIVLGFTTFKMYINNYGYTLNYTNKITNNNWLKG